MLLQVIHFRNAFEAVALQSSQGLPELLFYTKKSYKILQLQFQLQCYACTLHYNPENSPSRIHSAYRRQRALRVLQSRNSTHRRQGDLLEMHPCVYMTFQLLQLLQLLQRHSRHFQPSRQFYNVPVSPGNPPHSSILRLECIFYIFYNFYSSIGFHRKLHRVPVGQLQTLQTFILQRKGDVAISVKMSRCQDDIFPRIELIPSFVLSSDNTNCKNDIQLFHQLFDELSVHTDYH